MKGEKRDESRRRKISFDVEKKRDFIQRSERERESESVSVKGIA